MTRKAPPGAGQFGVQVQALLPGRSRRTGCVLGSGAGRVPQARCDESGRGGDIAPDRQGCSSRPRSWPVSDRLDQGSHDAPGADHRADNPWPRARCAVPGSRRYRDGRDRHGPRSGHARPPAGHEPGRYRQRDGDAERPAGKLIPDRHRAAPYGRPGEHQRRPAQHVIHIRPDSSSAGRGELDDRPLLGRHASKANGQRRPSAESNQSLAAHPAPSTSPAAITGDRGALRPGSRPLRGHNRFGGMDLLSTGGQQRGGVRIRGPACGPSSPGPPIRAPTCDRVGAYRTCVKSGTSASSPGHRE